MSTVGYIITNKPIINNALSLRELHKLRALPITDPCTLRRLRSLASGTAAYAAVVHGQAVIGSLIQSTHTLLQYCGPFLSSNSAKFPELLV